MVRLVMLVAALAVAAPAAAQVAADTTPPVLTLKFPKANVDGTPTLVMGATSISWEAVDAESPFTTVKLYLDDVPLGGFWHPQYTQVWMTDAMREGTYTLKVEAINEAGLTTAKTVVLRIRRVRDGAPGPKGDKGDPGPAGPVGTRALAGLLQETMVVHVISGKPVELLAQHPNGYDVLNVTLSPVTVDTSFLLVAGSGTDAGGRGTCASNRRELDFKVTVEKGKRYTFTGVELKPGEGLCFIPSDSVGDSRVEAQVKFFITK